MSTGTVSIEGRELGYRRRHRALRQIIEARRALGLMMSMLLLRHVMLTVLPRVRLLVHLCVRQRLRCMMRKRTRRLRLAGTRRPSTSATTGMREQRRRPVPARARMA